MTPLLGTTGGGSGRGFGRGFKGAAAPAGPSAAPSGLSATPAYAGSSTTAQMSLSWTNGDATATTEIYNNTTSTLVTTVSAGTTSYTVTGLNANASYSFKVRHLKNSQYSSYTSNASNTTYDYAGNVISTFQGTADTSVGNYTWCGSGYDKITTYADGYGSTYNGVASSNDYLSTDYVTLRVTAGNTGTYYPTGYPSSGVTQIKVFLQGAPGIEDAGSGDGYGGGGGGACWYVPITNIPQNVSFSYVVRDYGAGSYSYSSFNTLGATSAYPKIDGTTMTSIYAYTGYEAGGFTPGDGGEGTIYSTTFGRSGATQNYTPNPAGAGDYAANHAYGGGAGHDNTNKSGYSKGYPFGQGEHGSYFGGILAVVENA